MDTRLYLMWFLSLLAYGITSSISISIISIIFFYIGNLGIYLVQGVELRENSLFIFRITYMFSFIYALLCFIYMDYNGYDYLQSFDGINVYIPYTKELLYTNSFIDLIDEIYNTSKYAFVGSILILFVYTGKLSLLMDGELYVTLQLGIILFASWTIVLVYNILMYHNISTTKALKYTIIYALVSIHFLMSTFIVRDMPITFFFTALIYLSFKPYDIKIILAMVVLVLLISSIRLSSGIFASLYIFLSLVLSDKQGNSFKQKEMILFLLICLLFIYLYIDIIQATFLLKQEEYTAIEEAAGPSTVSTFNSLPMGISHLVKTFYNQFMPIPSWQIMLQTSYRPEAYNIMNFPIISATFFRYYMWFTIFVGLFYKEVRGMIIKNKILFFNIFLALLFLAIQSNTMGHRRVLGVYPVFFLVSVLIYHKLSNKDRKRVLEISFILFTLMQIMGFFKLL